MNNPASILSGYIDKSYITNLINSKNYDTIHVYVDIKNIMRSLYINSVVDEMITTSSDIDMLDSVIFQSILFYTSWWKSFCYNIKKELKIFYITDIGRSLYHNSIYSEYKHNRDITSSTYGISSDQGKNIRDRNFILSESICNRINNVHFILLKNLESDFITYYLINRIYNNNNNNIAHLIFSSDKDMYQILSKSDNIYQIYKIKNKNNSTYNIINKADIFRTYLKSNINIEIDANYIVLLMSILGDSIDDIPKSKYLKGIGSKGIINNYLSDTSFISYFGTIESLENRIYNDNKLFINIPTDSKYNLLLQAEQDIIRNYKLISFELLCKWLENRDNIDKINKLNYINNIIFNKTNDLNSNIMKIVLSKLRDNMLLDDTIDQLFL